MKNEDLKDRLLQNKDVKALEDEDLLQVAGGFRDNNNIYCYCSKCGYKGTYGEFPGGKCPDCGYRNDS